MNPDFASRLYVEAPAKVNLFLRVIRKRADGYHDLYTRMQKLSLCDELEIQLRDEPGIRLSCSSPEIPANSSNLAWKAAKVFLDACDMQNRCGVELHLIKKIPVAAGLGGGSSDAGVVLSSLNTLFDAGFSDAHLVTLARSIGADVPFFSVHYHAALAEGIGEILTPVPSLKGYTFVLVNPSFPVSTKQIFDNFTLTENGKASTLPDPIAGIQAELKLSEFRNDLESVTENLYPEIRQIKKRLNDFGSLVSLMSGSGPTVFGIFPTDFDPRWYTEFTQAVQKDVTCRVFITQACAGASPSGKGTGF